mgnify:CR=1 FL=1
MADKHKAGLGLVSLFDSIDRRLAQFSVAVGALLVLITVALVTYSVIMRYLLNTPQTWTDELVGYFLVAIVMLGVAESLRRGDHIGVDLLTDRLPGWGRKAMELWGMVAVIAVALAMVYSSYLMVAFSYQVELYSDGYVEAPLWIPQSALLIGYGLLALSAANRFLRLALGLPLPD